MTSFYVGNLNFYNAPYYSPLREIDRLFYDYDTDYYDDDIYQFELDELRDLYVELSHPYYSLPEIDDNAFLLLHRDSNNNGIFDYLNDVVLGVDTNDPFYDDFIVYQNASPGTYFAYVSSFDDETDYISYQIELSVSSPTILNTNKPIIDVNSDLNMPLYRFQSNVTPGTYLFVSEKERLSIHENFNLANDFTEEGIAFYATDTPGDKLIPLYRFQSNVISGTYLFVSEEERQNINQNFANSFTEEGLAFYVYGGGMGEQASFTRFQNSQVPGTYLYATGSEAHNIRTNYPKFIEEGISFEVRI